MVTPGRWAVLGNGTCWNVAHAGRTCRGTPPRRRAPQRCAGRLLHDAPELAIQDEIVMPGRQNAGFNEQDIAASFGPCDAGCHSRARHAKSDFLMKPWRAEVVGQVGRTHDVASVGVAGACHARGDLPHDGYRAGAPAVSRRLRLCTRRRSAEWLRPQSSPARPMLLQLPRHEIAAGDMELLLFAVSGQREDFHAVAQRRMNRLELVRGGDEEDS